jgi:branched-chain amino acid transport system permease protein
VAEQLYNAIFVGSIYALFAIGFALVFSVLDILNLAHPIVFMLGAFVAYFAMTTLGLPWSVAAPIAFLATGLFGVLLDRVAFAPLRRRSAPALSSMISSLAVGLIVVRLVELRYGGDFITFPKGTVPAFVIHVGDATLEGIRLAIIVLAVVLMLALTYVIRRTQLGRDLRALAENPRAARLLGVDVDRAIATTFFVSSALGGLAGVLLAFAYNTLDSRMGLPLELRAFTVMVVGGMGSLPGAVIGAYILGLGEVASLVYLPTELRDAFAFGLLFLVLVLRPTGLLGQRSPDRV